MPSFERIDGAGTSRAGVTRLYRKEVTSNVLVVTTVRRNFLFPQSIQGL
jgi:hypothetical protein